MRPRAPEATHAVIGGESLSEYFWSVSREPLLTPEEEKELAVLFREQGDMAAAGRLVKGNLRFVIRMAFRYRNHGLRMLDLIQEGNLGLLKAVERFDPTRDCRLVSYASWWIRAYIHDYILKNWSLVKIGTTQKQRRLFSLLRSSQRRLNELVQDSDAASLSEALAEYSGCKVREVEEMQQRVRSVDESIDSAGVSKRDMVDMLDCFGMPPTHEVVEERQSSQLAHSVVWRAVRELNARERRIVIARHLSHPPATLRELGEKLGISKERVRQLETGALKKLKAGVAAQTNIEDLLEIGS